MVSKANRYESIETENHRHESRNTQKKPRKFGFQQEQELDYQRECWEEEKKRLQDEVRSP